MSGNPFNKFFQLPGFDEEAFIGEKGLEYDRIKELGFVECKEGTGGFVVYRKENDLGGYDYLPFVDRWYPGNMPTIDAEKDRWLEGYDRGVVLFVMGEAQNRQYVKHPS
jgi:hypothetical protein